ncbi:MAG: YlbF family regulator [Clostridia bacterium]|nr:YlbF family regulator [Clostridia bacterium]MBQ4157556.1 YlbF family regulator [Clostridia bacterium]
MNEVFLKTRELGEAIMRSEEYKKMKEAENIAMKNEEAANTMGKYLEYRSQVEQMMASGDKDWAKVQMLNDKMTECQERMNMLDDIVNLNQAREGFSNLINQVNSVLRFIVTGEMEEDEGCTGSCETCAGCRGVN